MSETLLLGLGRHLLPIPHPGQQRQVAGSRRANRAAPGFVPDDQHRVRDLAVVELPRAATPLPPELIAERWTRRRDWNLSGGCSLTATTTPPRISAVSEGSST